MSGRSRRTSPAPNGRTFDDLGPLQQEIMAAVWDLGEVTVQALRDRLEAAGRPLAYTTVLSAMQKLEKLDWLTHREDGRTYVYRPTRSWARESRQSISRSLRHIFRGDRTLLLQQLIADDDITDDELLELRRLIQTRRKEIDQ